jgi:quercetin dioxygenase-like cupin family protein
MTAYVVPDSEARVIEIQPTGGIKGTSRVKVFIDGEHLMAVGLNLDEGFEHPLHTNPGNEPVGYVVSGKLRMLIGGKERIVGPGSMWHHPQGVGHATTALEDTMAIEIHYPPREDYR